MWKLIGQRPILPYIVGLVGLLALTGWIMKARHEGLTLVRLGLALATTFTFTLYAWIYHYELLAPILLYLLRDHRRWGLVVYLSTWTAAIRLASSGVVYNNDDILYPLTLLIALWLVTFRQWYVACKTPSPAAADEGRLVSK